MNNDKTLIKNENDYIENINNELERMKKEIKNLTIKMNIKEDDIKNIITEKDIIINELNNRINEQEKLITENKNKIINLNKKIDEMNNNISKDLSNLQNNNKEEINKFKNNIKNDNNILLNKIYDKYNELNFCNFINSNNILEDKKIYRVIVVGEAGVGKSQFCNYVNKDLTNSIYKVGDDFQSTTKTVFTNKFKRLEIDFEFIDTPGCEDSYQFKDYFRQLYELKEEKKFDYIIYTRNFYDRRITSFEMEFIQNLSNIFTKEEFYSHSCIVFTHYCGKTKYKEYLKNHINSAFGEIFFKNKDRQIPNIKTYFIDDDFEDDYDDEENQEIIDNLLKQIKLYIDNFGSISYTQEIKNIENVDLRIKKLEIDNFKKEVCTLQ